MKFSLFCGFWENLEHKFTKKMDVCFTSFKQTCFFAPLPFYPREETLICETLWSVKSGFGLAPPTASSLQALTGRPAGKTALWSLMPPVWRKAVQSRERSASSEDPSLVAEGEFGLQAWEEQWEELYVDSSCQAQSVTQSGREDTQGKGTLQGE